MKKLLIPFLILPLVALSQSVKGNFAPAEDFTYAFLYKSTPKGADYIERGHLDSLGNFEIKLDSSITAGIYKIVYAIPPEENNFDFIYDGKENVAFKFSHDEGVRFIESEENKLWSSYLKSIDMVNQTISNYFARNNSDKKGFQAIFKTLKDTQTGYEELAEGKLVLSYIKSNRPYIPSEYETISTYSTNLKAHYLSQIDFSDPLLQSSSFLLDRVTAYVFNMVEDPTDAVYKQHIDDVAAAINQNNLIIKSTLLQTLWQHFVDFKNPNVANYITDQYLLKLAKASNNTLLEDVIVAYKKSSIGAKASNFEISLNGNKTSLHQLEGAEHYLIVFWSSTCSHCLTHLPEVKDLVAKYPKLKVIAYGLESNTRNWEREIKKYPNFIHEMTVDKWNAPIVKDYNITATPMYYLLDSTKIIIAKPSGVKNLEYILERL